MRVMSGPTSARTRATSWGEQTRARAPAPTASTASRRTASRAGPSSPTCSRSFSSIEVSTVTAAISVSGAASTAARTMSAPPPACTVRMAGLSPATLRAAPATVAGMSWSLRSRKTPTPPAPRTALTTSGP